MGKKNNLSTRQLLSTLENYINSNANRTFSIQELKQITGVENPPKEIAKAAESLVKENKVLRTPDGRYTFPNTKKQKKKVQSQKTTKHDKPSGLIGKIDKTRSGAAFVVVEGREKDIFVPPRRMKTALHRDTVRVEIVSDRRRPEGEVLEVIKRDRDRFVGNLIIRKNHGIVETEDGKTHFDIKVFDDKIHELNEGTIVVVKVEKWPVRKGQFPIGKITTVLGKSGSNEVEMNSILIQNGFNLVFPDEVQKEANRLTGEVTEEEVLKRRDFRPVPTLTIDPSTAKDFDDALSYRTFENGDYEVGIHIADVTHYLKEGGAMDEEAKKRTTSVYLVDRVCPMLPERLSNDLCSLRPNEDRFAFSAVFIFSKNHKIKDRWFGKSIIHSDQRFAYEDAFEILEGKPHKLEEEVNALNEVALRLREYRFNNGSISFETDEVEFELDENGHPTEIYVKERNAAHMMVEDLMLMANREVATHIIEKSKKAGKEIPFLYRIHDTPDPDKINDFAAMAKEVGFQFKFGSAEAIAESFNTLVEKARHDDALKILEPLAIRTMAKAEYSTDNIGHYGLGFENYTHFTSPIRRYADVWVHRILQEQLKEGAKPRNKEDLQQHAGYISDIERKAQEAERESIRFKKAEYIEHQVGAILPGYVSGVIEKGVFVELEGTMAEGLVPFSELDEPFVVEPRKYRATGKNTGLQLKMGTRVRVKIQGVNLTRREIEMDLVSVIHD